MQDFADVISASTKSASAVETPKDQLPREASSEIEGALPKLMVMGFGEMGISKNKTAASLFDFNISTRERFLLRKRHSLLAAAHNAIIKAVKKVELSVEVIDPNKDFNEKTKERMEAFAKNGFGPFGEKEFRAQMVDTKKWNGDAWAELVFDVKTNEPLLEKYLMAETMWIKANDYGQVVAYPQVIDGQISHIFSPDNIIHMREHVDEYSLFGYSDVDSLFVTLLVDALAEEFNQKTLQNFAMPGGVLSFEDNIPPEELLRLRLLFIKQHQRQPNKPIFLNRIKQWFPMSMDMKDMDWEKLRRFNRERVFSIYGVLPMQASIVETGKLANPDQQLEIGSEYIRQEMQTLEATYNLKLTPHFENSENLKFCFGDVDPKPEEERKDAELQKIKADTAKVLSTIPGLYTKDEIRAATGHEPLNDGTGEEYVQQPTPFGFGQDLNASPFGQDAAKALAGKPFAGYEDFNDCVEQNADKENPQAYCASIMQTAERGIGAPERKALMAHKSSAARNRKRFSASLEKIAAAAARAAIKEARKVYPKTTKTPGSFEAALGPIIAVLRAGLEQSVKDNALRTFKDAKAALHLSLNQRDERAVLALLHSSGGALDASAAYSADQKAGFLQVFKDAYDKGLDERQMAKELRNFADIETYKLTRIARTETNRFSNQGRFAGYKELEERRGEQYEYEWVGPEDERTSEICSDIKAGNPYSLENIMQVTDGGEPHPNCRHNIVRVVK